MALCANMEIFGTRSPHVGPQACNIVCTRAHTDTNNPRCRTAAAIDMCHKDPRKKTPPTPFQTSRDALLLVTVVCSQLTTQQEGQCAPIQQTLEESTHPRGMYTVYAQLRYMSSSGESTHPSKIRAHTTSPRGQGSECSPLFRTLLCFFTQQALEDKEANVPPCLARAVASSRAPYQLHTCTRTKAEPG